jgi:hypothetical protein
VTHHRAAIEDLGTVSSLKQERLALADLGEVSSESDDLRRSDDGRKMAQFSEDAEEWPGNKGSASRRDERKGGRLEVG